MTPSIRNIEGIQQLAFFIWSALLEFIGLILLLPFLIILSIYHITTNNSFTLTIKDRKLDVIAEMPKIKILIDTFTAWNRRAE